MTDARPPAGEPAGSKAPVLEDREEGRGLLGPLAYVVFIAIGSLWMFWFAASLGPATKAQAEAACRALEPELRSGPAPEFSLQDRAGQTVNLADLRGKFVVINFWATWCEPCIREWPQLDRLAERLADRDDVVILAVSVDQDQSLVAPFLARMGLEQTGVRVLWDPTGKLHTAYGSEKLPDTYFVGADGQLVHAYINVRDWGRPAAHHCVESMLAR
ncbi:peroxiredoxin family protein [Nannocystis pusilla]|uniref:peroxiredoxin family protein n=1 Tax=Nannocystis pusilla TaxID=889268 RepID=UPI003DA3C55A